MSIRCVHPLTFLRKLRSRSDERHLLLRPVITYQTVLSLWFCMGNMFKWCNESSDAFFLYQQQAAMIHNSEYACNQRAIVKFSINLVTFRSKLAVGSLLQPEMIKSSNNHHEAMFFISSMLVYVLSNPLQNFRLRLQLILVCG